jgi:hypothetical protein
VGWALGQMLMAAGEADICGINAGRAKVCIGQHVA